MKKSASSFQLSAFRKTRKPCPLVAGSPRLAAGFTLIETIIVIFIFGVVMLAVFDMFARYGAFSQKQSATIDVARSAAAIVTAVEDAVREARAIAPSRTVSGTTYTTGSGTLVLELPAVNGSGDVVAGAFDYAIFYASGTSAYRLLDTAGGSVRPSGSKHLTSVLGSLTFLYNDPTPANATMVTVDATTTALVRQQTISTHLTSQALLRNK